VLAIAMALAWHVLSFAIALRFAAAAPPAARAALGLLTIAPLAFAMGLPFPLGLARLARTAPAFVPWAWGLNGCASVIAAIAALLLAIEVGLTTTLLLALALYVVAAWTWRTETRGDEFRERSYANARPSLADQYRSMGSTSSDHRTLRADGSV
jgi:hypothetical protein